MRVSPHWKREDSGLCSPHRASFKEPRRSKSQSSSRSSSPRPGHTGLQSIPSVCRGRHSYTFIQEYPDELHVYNVYFLDAADIFRQKENMRSQRPGILI